MKQTRTDTWMALVQAVALHAVLFAVLFAGLRWSQRQVAEAAQGDPIEADLVAVSDLSASMQRALQRAPKAQPAPPPEPDMPAPLPEPVAEAAPPQPKVLPPPVPDPAPVEQEKVQRDAPSPQVAKLPREQEQQRRQPDQAELQSRQQQEQARQKERQLAELRRLREQAARERSLAEQRAQQLAEARTPAASTAPPPGNRGTDPSLQAKYAAALQQAILRQWIRPETVPLGQRCRISIRQLQGGEVVDVSISGGCPYDAAGRQSVERAVYKASPLPYAGFEAVFNRNLDLNFVAEER